MSGVMSNLTLCFLPNLHRERDARRRSREIDAMLKREKKSKPLPGIIVLSGTRESGKSTFLKQMRIINGEEFNHKERLIFREAIYKNIIKGMQVLVVERNRLGIPWQNSANEMHKKLVMSVEVWTMNFEPCTFQVYINAVDSLWKDSGIQETYRRRNGFHLCETVKYFFDNIHHIGNLNYLPSNQDILYAHKSNKAIAETYFVFREIPFMITNMSFLQFLWRWTGSPDGITSIIFMATSSEYDQLWFEENRLVESLNVFEVVVNNRLILNTPIILFLNQMDLLVEKIQTVDIRKNFPEFQGDPHKLEDVQAFLVQSFDRKRGNNRQPVFHHFITAVDTENIRLVFHTVKDMLLQRSLKDFMLQ
ncbi:guanine nucleotide-binding protein subunit alpha-12-like isoform X1 [Myxocyprinus asiaticus]|uniref:guanine nucleotide-binding protein subunit alpha-12-like isoform X1 n=1 Tax=Myxocyprinus asiaticus TaxID=70543 RepID=UPI002223280D|nr:guanine nucleotide-binding protein subunit alpha-12-like isoform X1 [Myxocyprinus asiaticus]XP_051558810.1 guanine nucleotide-binding protein subunit alpha-12-like isoform X1 [Myxocyprinus asiaticus]